MNQRILNLCSATSLAGVAAMLMLPVSTAAIDQKETEHVERTLAFPAGGSLQLHNFAGDVHISGTAGKDLVIKAVRHAERDRLDHIKLDIQTTGSTVMIEANKRDPAWQHHKNNNVVETSFEIEVPAEAQLNVEVFSSRLDIKGINGAQRLKAFSGSITVDAAAAGATPRLSAETFSGGIQVRLAESVKLGVSFQSFSGKFDTELPLVRRSDERNQLSAAPSSAPESGALRFTTFSGSLHISK